MRIRWIGQPGIAGAQLRTPGAEYECSDAEATSWCGIGVAEVIATEDVVPTTKKTKTTTPTTASGEE